MKIDAPLRMRIAGIAPARRAGAMPWTPLAVFSYLGNVALGMLSRRGRGPGRAWHTRLFVMVCALTAVAAALSFPARRPRGLLLAAALVPLALLPFLGAQVARRPLRHMLVGLAPAPCYLAALALWIRDP